MDFSKYYKILHDYFPFGFQLSRQVWEDLDLRDLMKSLKIQRGAMAFHAVRVLGERFNERYARHSQLIGYIYPGQLISIGIIVDILRYLLYLYAFSENAGSLNRGMEWVGRRRGREVVNRPPPEFIRLFPPQAVMRRDLAEETYLIGSTPEASHQEMVSGEMLLLMLSMENPAFIPFREFFNDADLKKRTPYQSCTEGLEKFLAGEPIFSLLGQPLMECLRAPLKASPDSIEGQIEYIRKNWARFLPPELLEQLLLASDILKEEKLLRGLGPGPNVALDLRRLYEESDYPEPAAFSRDADWMSNVVILAKSVYVWLDQLSRKYGRAINRLDDIPDEELNRLARWGFTGLWLIGLWERSPASRKIKQMTGNPEAASSAYSLYDYVIASDLGGEDAYYRLRDRAWTRGIRLASDMVPNHTGIYSKWMVEHPDWFIQLSYSPFPVYQFNGQDLSDDDRVMVQIEDGYWDRRDAAVVFKRTDKFTGDSRYIYHGNDGTSMPWNDTAQLDFTKAEVREAVIQTIIHVARKFPIIRFDAAMTLAKKHYQRLWFPRPGEGGAIPSRAEHGLARSDFDGLFPKEFWREVVDRVALEVPDTLLIAEAFWLMEGYFVRTLGMHRVYNSAFMNMLKMEDNAKYRSTVKNVLEFSPEVIKRFVNFMNNPDERTAVEQFGKGDKYYGVAVMMVTMPGLPMFGHGQIEGFTEKYGMEYRRAYWDEPIDEEMVRRHETEIFPLMRRRRLFSGADNFAFYDFVSPGGWVDESVFAYSNRAGGERAVVLYNNAYNTTRGRIHASTQINVGSSDKPDMMRLSLVQALNLETGDDVCYRFREYRSGLEYLATGRQLAEEGLFSELYAYQYQVFLDFEKLDDPDGLWRKLTRRLEGRGVPILNEALQEMQMESVLIPFRELLGHDLVRNRDGEGVDISKIVADVVNFYGAAAHQKGVTFYADDAAQLVRDRISRIMDGDISAPAKMVGARRRIAKEAFDAKFIDDHLHVLYAWVVLRQLPNFMAGAGDDIAGADILRLFDDWLLRKALVQSFENVRENAYRARLDAELVELVLKYGELPDRPIATWEKILADRLAGEFLQLNRYEDTLYFNKERYEELVRFILVTDLINLKFRKKTAAQLAAKAVKKAVTLLEAGGKAGYKAEKIKDVLVAK